MEKKAVAKKAPKQKIAVQWDGKSFEQDEILKLAKKAWMKEFKKKAGDLKDAKVYVKVEENMAYYVMNGTDSGKVSLV